MTYSRPWMILGLTFMAAGAIMLFHQRFPSEILAETAKPASQAAKDGQPPHTPSGRQPSAETDRQPPSEKTDDAKWKCLFDGKTLGSWKTPELGGEGKVAVKDGTIVLGMGTPMTAIVWTGEVLRNNYELSLEGKRIDGSDFFCTTTFPVGNDPCTLVVGGWGGQLVGLSNVDHFDASENPTTRTVAFEENRWYPVRIRVCDGVIQAWIDGNRMVSQPRKGHKFSVRMEVETCRPLGIATWYTSGAVRNIRVRPLSADEIRESVAKWGKPTDDD